MARSRKCRAAINGAQTFLPAGLPTPPIYNKTNPADAPVLTLALTSKSMPLTEVEDLADTRLAEKIAQLSGVGLVSISGGQKQAVRVQVNPTALSAYGINLEDVRTALGATSLDQAKGNFDGPEQAYQIQANDQLMTSTDCSARGRGLSRRRAGAAVGRGGTSSMLPRTSSQAAWMNTTPAVIVNIQRQPGANIIQVVDRITALLPSLKSTLPAAVQLSVLTDRTTTIRASVSDVEFELMLTVGLVVMVIFLFLRNVSATIIPSVAVPLSLIGTLAVMYLAGYSLNNLTLMALTISTGFVVDDAIVMIENITRYIEAGDAPLDAALKGSEQIGFTIVSLTISLIVAVLIPLLFMGDIVGRLFREFAVTLSVTILVSAVVSLTLTPMMCSRLLRRTRPKTSRDAFTGRPSAPSRRVIEILRPDASVGAEAPDDDAARGRGDARLEHRPLCRRAQGVFPCPRHRHHPGHFPERPQSVSFAGMAERQQALAQVILKDPAVASLSSFIGADGTNTTLNSGRMLINLKPLSDRRLTASDVISRLQPAMARVQDITLYLKPVQDVTVDDRTSRMQYQSIHA